MKVIISENKKVVKESYEVSDDLVAKLNSILADEFLASEYYRLVRFAMKGNKMHRLDDVAAENGFDELDDHFKNLCEWMQSKGIPVELDREKMAEITNCTKFDVVDGMDTKEVVNNLIQSEEEAIDVYETIIPETDLDLNIMLCGFLKDEREHLKSLLDIRDEMGGKNEEPEPTEPIEEPVGDEEEDNQVYIDDNPDEDDEEENGDEEMVQESDDDYMTYSVYDIDWDDDGEEVDLPGQFDIDVPMDIHMQGSDAVHDWISDALCDEYGFCHNGFGFSEVGKKF